MRMSALVIASSIARSQALRPGFCQAAARWRMKRLIVGRGREASMGNGGSGHVTNDDIMKRAAGPRRQNAPAFVSFACAALLSCQERYSKESRWQPRAMLMSDFKLR